MEQESPAETFSREFFFAGNGPTNTHEEWLLRLCSQLMHREASAIRIAEANAQRNAGRRAWKNSSNASRGSNSASTAMDPETSATS